MSKRGRLLLKKGNVESVHAFRHFVIDMTLVMNKSIDRFLKLNIKPFLV